MRDYLEANENVQDIDIEPDFIRIDITGMTEVEKDTVLADIQDIMAGKDYRLVYHQCGHEDGVPCQTEAL